MRRVAWHWWLAGALAGALAALGAVAVAAGGTGQGNVQTTVTVTPGVVVKVLYACGVACTTPSGTLPFGPANGGQCQPGNGVATCSASNVAEVSIASPGASTFALSAYDTPFTDGAGDTMPGSALNLSPCAIGGCFTGGYIYDPLSANAASPTSLWAGVALAPSGPTYVGVGNEVGFPKTVWANVVIPAATVPGNYGNTVTFVVTAS